MSAIRPVSESNLSYRVVVGTKCVCMCVQGTTVSSLEEWHDANGQRELSAARMLRIWGCLAAFGNGS